MGTGKLVRKKLYSLLICALTLWNFQLTAGGICTIPESERSLNVKAKMTPHLSRKCHQKRLALGAPIYIRIFKQDRELELWMKQGENFQLFKTYRICAMSGKLGPKRKAGDKQAPEGFYKATPGSLNPRSGFHLSVNVGYPNNRDQCYGCTGNLIMIHGSYTSKGCFAMTDAGIEEIYTLISEAMIAGQKEVPIHIFPFKMTPIKFLRHRKSEHLKFWKELQPMYHHFEKTRSIPNIEVKNGTYCHVENMCIASNDR